MRSPALEQQTAWSPKISLGCVHIGQVHQGQSQGSPVVLDCGAEDAGFEDSVVTIFIGGDSDNKSTSMDLGRTGQTLELAFVRSSGEKPVVESFVDRKGSALLGGRTPSGRIQTVARDSFQLAAKATSACSTVLRKPRPPRVGVKQAWMDSAASRTLASNSTAWSRH